MINGCLEYTVMTVDISFEKGDESCKFCPLLETYARNQCRRTGEYIVDTRGRGRWCPLKEANEQFSTFDR